MSDTKSPTVDTIDHIVANNWCLVENKDGSVCTNKPYTPARHVCLDHLIEEAAEGYLYACKQVSVFSKAASAWNARLKQLQAEKDKAPNEDSSE